MSFSLSSDHAHIKGSHLHAHSRRADGSWNEHAKIDLDQYIGNDNGHLVWGSGGFSASSRDIHLKDGHILEAEARRIDGSWNKTHLDLNHHIGNSNGDLGSYLHAHCRRMDGSWNENTKINLDQHIGNDNGQLVWGGEKFSQSVRNVHLKDGRVIECEAKRIDGSWGKTFLDLNERIGNSDGNLVHS